ncbi:MAG: heme lyase CcmF/NrfE family subunit [Anaerolineae bacterium]|nr:heme lyase CcmF/NrfE family subunit [Anaerolineae bacterium]
MFAEFGIITTALALVCAVFATLASAYGALNKTERWVLSARNAALLTWPLITTSALILLAAQYSGDYSIKYVYDVTNSTEPLFYKMTALWGGQPGSLLFWAWAMSTFTSLTLLLNWRSDRRLMPWVITFTMLTLSFFLILNNIYENPFERFWAIPGHSDVIAAVFQPANYTLFTPVDGRGLNPLLRHPGMVIHPPMLYAGYVGMTIPWAFAMAALASGQLNTNWIKATRRWTLVAWLFLSLGLLLGGRWAYDVLGWGGYWGWDPVENAALLPWLTGTAFLHSVMIQEKRGMLKVWNMFLIILTFLLVILGTFATRSGIVASVHSFAQSAIGVPMLVFVGSTIVGCLAIWAWRWQRGDLASDHQLDALVSRESMFVLNNWIFVGITIMVLWGTYAPVFSEIFTGQQITLGKEYYNAVVVPLFGAMYVLMGIAPLVAWKKASFSALGRAIRVPLVLTVATVAVLFVTGTHNGGALLGYGLIFFAGYTTVIEYARGVRARMGKGENPVQALARLFTRSRQRYGGYFIHLGVVVIGIGVIGSTLFQMQTQETISQGESISLGNMTMVYTDAFSAMADDGRDMVIANVAVYRDGQHVADIRPRKDDFQNQGMTMTIAGQYTTLESDFYVLLTNWEGQRLTFHVYLNPLINLVWWGGMILMIGTIIAAWPTPQRDSLVRSAEAASPGQLQLAGD